MHQPPPTQQLPTLRKKQGESNFFRLPPELRLQVYSYLPLPDAQSLRLTLPPLSTLYLQVAQ